MHLRCPHCKNPIEVVDLSAAAEISCAACGSSFRLEQVSTTAWDEFTGKRFGKFEVLGTVGRGAFGTVLKARDTELERTVALKIPRPGNVGHGPQDVERFLREARSVAQLRHPSITTIHEVGEWRAEGGGPPVPYLVCDFVEGITLADLLSARRPSFAESASLIADVAQALHYAHSQGVVHRDVKPSNIMLESAERGAPSAEREQQTQQDGPRALHSALGAPRLMDFGLAKRDAAEITMTIDGQVLGTPAYMSPEQARGEGHRADARSDVYSVGVMLYELLTGELPFRGNRNMLLHQVLHEEPRPPRRLNDKVPRALETICLKCLAKEPARRYPSAGQLADDLRRFLRGEPILARPVGRLERLWLWCRRRPAAAAVYGLLLLVSILGGLGGTMYWLWQDATAAHLAAESQRQKAEQAKINEEHERKKAENAFLAEQKIRQELDKAQDVIARYKYASDINLAHRMALSRNWQQARSLWLSCPVHLRGWEWDYVEHLLPTELTLEGHKGGVRSVSFSPDGRRLASASDDRTVKVWDLALGKETLSLEGHKERVRSVSFTPDGRRLASASDDNTVKVWDLALGKETLSLEGHRSSVTSVSFSPDGRRLASASLDRTVKVWDLALGKETLSLEGHKDWVSSVSFSPDGRRLASASSDKTVKVWDLPLGKETLSLEGHKKQVSSVSFSPDGRRLASASLDETVKVWDLTHGKETLSLEGHKSIVTSVSFSPDGRRLASAAGNSVKVWDLALGKETLSLEGHQSTVTSVSFSPDGRRLASASWDETVKVWDLTQGKETLSLEGHKSSVTSVSFSPDGRRLASASHDVTVKVWDLALGKETLSLAGHNRWITSVSFSSAGRRLASGSHDKTVKVWDLALGKETLSLEGHKGLVTSVSFSSAGRHLASGSHDKTVKVWDLALGKETLSLEGHKGLVTSVSFSPDGRRLASASHDKTVKVWDLALGKETLSLEGHKNFVMSVRFSPDGRRLASASWDRTVKVWDLAAGKETLSLEGHKEWVTSVGFSPDGRRLASASGDKTVKVWDLALGKETLSLEGHKDVVLSVRFSPDGRRLASASWDGTVKVWEALDTRHLWHLRDAVVCEREKDWFAAAFHLRQCIEQETGYTAAEALAGADSYPLGIAAGLAALRHLEGRTPLADLQARLAHAQEEWKKVK